MVLASPTGRLEMTTPTWQQCEQYGYEYSFKAKCSRKGSVARANHQHEADWWANLAKEMKACTYDAGQDTSDGFITFDDGSRRPKRLR